MLMNYRKSRRGGFLMEGASIDNFDDATPEVKDTVKELEDDLTNNVPTVDAPEVSNGDIQDAGVDATAESAVLYKVPGSRRPKYLVKMDDVLRIQEGAAKEEAGESEDTAPAESEAEPAECTTQAGDVVEQIADANGVDKEDITVVIQAKECAILSQAAICESAAGYSNGWQQKRLRAMKAAITDLTFSGIDMVRI